MAIRGVNISGSQGLFIGQPNGSYVSASNGDLTVTGNIVAKEFYTEFVSASVVYSSGSNIFGDSQSDQHTFTGSLNVNGTGSLDYLNVNKNVSIIGGDLDIDGGGVAIDENIIFTDANYGQIKFGANKKIDFTDSIGVVVFGDISASGTFRTSATEHRFEGDISSSGATIHKVKQFADGDTTPNVSNGTMFKTANSGGTDITGFDNGSPGQIVYVLVQDNNTDFSDGTNFQLFRGLDHTSAQINDTITFACVDGTKWVELGRSDNT